MCYRRGILDCGPEHHGSDALKFMATPVFFYEIRYEPTFIIHVFKLGHQLIVKSNDKSIVKCTQLFR